MDEIKKKTKNIDIKNQRKKNPDDQWKEEGRTFEMNKERKKERKKEMKKERKSWLIE